MKPALSVLFLIPVLATAQPVLEPGALGGMEGQWSGELMYIDYSSGAETHIPATLTVEMLGRRSWRRTFAYPGEPGSDEVDTLVLSPDGNLPNDGAVSEVAMLGDGVMQLTLLQDGEDDDVPVRIRKVWTIGPNSLMLRKEVCPIAGGPLKLRHKYLFAR